MSIIKDISELNDSPFGRDLAVLAHRLPRSSKHGLDWELERGFHLSVLGSDFLEFTLASRMEKSENPSLPLIQTSDNQGQDSFLIWHCPGLYTPERFQEFADLAKEKSHMNCALILSHTSEHRRALMDYPSYRHLWKAVDKPVLQVFQDFPTASYFTVEKNLFDLGRIGRRLSRLGKIRRLMPW